MNESILTSIKKLLGIAKENTDFDQDIIAHINAVIMVLRQMGVGPAQGFVINDETSTWKDYLGESDYVKFSSVKSYIYLKTKQLFDPTTGGAVTESTNNLIKELEFRLYIEAELPHT